jgi:hypothetical protein
MLSSDFRFGGAATYVLEPCMKDEGVVRAPQVVAALPHLRVAISEVDGIPLFRS